MCCLWRALLAAVALRPQMQSSLFGTAYANTSTGNQTITLNASFTPTFAIVALSGALSGTNPNAGALLSWGMTDGTNVRAVGVGRGQCSYNQLRALIAQ